MEPKTIAQDIAYVKKLLPTHYTVSESETPGSVHCKSPLGIVKPPYSGESGIVDDAEDPEHWSYIMQALKKNFGDRFQEVNHNVCSCHMDFTIYLKNSN